MSSLETIPIAVLHKIHPPSLNIDISLEFGLEVWIFSNWTI